MQHYVADVRTWIVAELNVQHVGARNPNNRLYKELSVVVQYVQCDSQLHLKSHGHVKSEAAYHDNLSAKFQAK